MRDCRYRLAWYGMVSHQTTQRSRMSSIHSPRRLTIHESSSMAMSLLGQTFHWRTCKMLIMQLSLWVIYCKKYYFRIIIIFLSSVILAVWNNTNYSSHLLPPLGFYKHFTPAVCFISILCTCTLSDRATSPLLADYLTPLCSIYTQSPQFEWTTWFPPYLSHQSQLVIEIAVVCHSCIKINMLLFQYRF